MEYRNSGGADEIGMDIYCAVIRQKLNRMEDTIRKLTDSDAEWSDLIWIKTDLKSKLTMESLPQV